MYKIMISDMLGMDTDDIRFEEGDTDKVSFGMGTVGPDQRSPAVAPLDMPPIKSLKKEKSQHTCWRLPKLDIEFDQGRFLVRVLTNKSAYEMLPKRHSRPPRCRLE